MSETLRLSVEGKMLNARYVDLLQHKPIDTRTGDEIALDIIERLDIKVN
ncbi:MAG: hypothetical protein MJ007_01880 [Paludibacteraceae bacterium]|nr:hypothetical protein [Paludibacteraceae bacterium]